VYDLFWLYGSIYFGYSVGFILDIVYDLFWLKCRIYFGYNVGLYLVIL